MWLRGNPLFVSEMPQFLAVSRRQDHMLNGCKTHSGALGRQARRCYRVLLRDHEAFSLALPTVPSDPESCSQVQASQLSAADVPLIFPWGDPAIRAWPFTSFGVSVQGDSHFLRSNLSLLFSEMMATEQSNRLCRIIGSRPKNTNGWHHTGTYQSKPLIQCFNIGLKHQGTKCGIAEIKRSKIWQGDSKWAPPDFKLQSALQGTSNTFIRYNLP